MSKYNIPDDQWEDNEPEGPPAWKEDTSADIVLNITLHKDGYQNSRKWRILCSEKIYDDRLVAVWGYEYQNKGNYWRDPDLRNDGEDFADLPLKVRQRTAHVLNRDLNEITPEHTINNDD